MKNGPGGMLRAFAQEGMVHSLGVARSVWVEAVEKFVDQVIYDL